MTALPVHWRWATETALLATVATPDLAAATRGALALHRQVGELVLPAVAELVPAAGSLLILLDGDPAQGAASAACLLGIVEVDSPAADSAADHARRFTIEVSYGGADGADLGAVAVLCGLTEREVVARHCAPLYTVGFVGFSPGFPYLLGLPAELAVPRLASPRPRVPAGTVAIAGPFAAIYPQATPGGWRLLGRAALPRPLFDPNAEPPALLAAGDRLRFVAV